MAAVTLTGEIVQIVVRVSSEAYMYVCKTEYTIGKLTKTRNDLNYSIHDVLDMMRDARHNGWSPMHKAEGWVVDALKCVNDADETLLKYKKDRKIILDADSSWSNVVQIIHCPCNALESRSFNTEVVSRLKTIKKHEKDGNIYLTSKFTDVACRKDQLVRRVTPWRKQIDDLLDKQAPVVHLLNEVNEFHSKELHPLKPNSSDHGNRTVLRPQPSVNEQNKEVLEVPIADFDKLKLSAFVKYHALAQAESYENVPVMIQVKAPRHARWARAAIDLVMILDVSCDESLKQLKQGALLVIHNLEPQDKLSILQSFQAQTRSLFSLTYMSEKEKDMAKTMVSALFIIDDAPTTDIMPALKTAHQILDGRPLDKNRVSSIMLLTDGFDKAVGVKSLSSHYPTYTFGIGPDTDPYTMYDLAVRGHGTYSFVHNKDSKSIRNAMATCMGGLTSIVAQQVKISINSAQEGVSISSIACGAYDHLVDGGNLSGSVTIDDIWGTEEKSFIVYIDVPVAQGMTNRSTKLLVVEANYYCHVTRACVKTDQTEVSVKRHMKVRGQPSHNSNFEVAKEVIRANVLEQVREIATRSREQVDDGYLDITDELRRIQDDIGDTWEDIGMDLDLMQEAGLRYMLSWLSSHQWQRVATPGSTFSRNFNFKTPRMQNMIDSVESAPI